MQQPGQVKRIGAIEQVTDKFKKRDLILDIPGQFPQVIKFEAVQDKCHLLDNLMPGQNIVVHFNLNGREHNNNIYNTLQIWKVE